MNPIARDPSESKAGPAPRLRVGTPYRRRRLPSFVDLRLDGNEGPAACEALREALQGIDPEVARRYPDAGSLEHLLAERHGVPEDCVLVTAGADEALDRIFRAYGGPGRTAVMPEPTFEMIPRYAELAGCEITRVPWWDGTFPTESYLARSAPSGTSILCVVSPNNPTGLVAEQDAVRRLAEARPECLVVLDQAYVEYATAGPTTPLLDLGNVVVVRTLSKAVGVAGLRIGYAIGRRDCIEVLRAAAGPYPVAGPSVVAALRILQGDPARTDVHVARVQTERALLRDKLKSHGFEVVPSEANFVHVVGAQTSWLADALESLGILVRRFDDGRDVRLRITCPGAQIPFDRLVAGIDAAMGPDALLFDIDGVLADVSRSYRQAILTTARSFGVDLTSDAVRALKAAGDANNDWIVTQRALASHGMEVPIERVTAEFERHYQGTPAAPGLRELESCLVDRDVLERLAQTIPIGIVTGRPRADAERFLDAHGLRGLCQALVCMEDAPAKPNPAPIALAMERLDARSAWFFGDTPDDVVAARRAGAIPIGITPPGDPPDEARASLERAGAARVHGSLTDLPNDRRRLLALMETAR
jgi:histidinol-phosphate aminotransferase